MRSVVPFLLALAVGCAPEPQATEARPAVHVTGALERLDPGDPESPWVGVETVQVTDSVGTCVTSRRVAAVEAEACPDCAVLLDDVDVWPIGEIADCATDLSEVPAIGGRVVFRSADDVDGVLFVDTGDRWLRYSRGVLEGGGLTWHHQVGDDAELPDPDLRDLPEPPPAW